MRAYLFDADGSDCEIDIGIVRVRDLTPAQLLWIDLDPEVSRELDAAGAALGFDRATITAVTEPADDPSLVLHRGYFHLDDLIAVEGSGEGYRAVHWGCIAGRRWVLTSHHEPLAFLERFDDRFRGRATLVCWAAQRSRPRYSAT